MQRIVDHIRVPAGVDWREVLYEHQMRGEVGQVEQLASQLSLQSDKVKLADPRVPAEKVLIDMVADLCEARGIPHIPRIGICDSNIPNAFSVSGQAVVFSTNIKEIMEYDELKAIVGHELSHHRHTVRDSMVNLGLAYTGYEIVSRALQPLYTVGGNMGEVLNYGRSRLAAWAIAGVSVIGGSALTTFWRRHMEVEADKEGAELTSPTHMKNAFLKLDARVEEIQQHHEQKPRTLVSQIFRFVTEPISVHPKTEDRVKHMERLEARKSKETEGSVATRSP